jgi:general secretion pathway protein D
LGAQKDALGGLARHLTSALLFAALCSTVFLLLLVAVVDPAAAQRTGSFPEAREDELVSLDFSDVELPVVIDTISRMTGYNFIYDDRVRGRVTIVSPTQVTVEQAFAVFESVLKVKGFSLVLGPGDTYKIIPIRDVKESSIDTIKDGRPSPNRDRFVTRLVPLRFIDAEAITQTIKPLVSKDASLVAYSPTNTIIVTDSESNIRRLLSILDAIDVESYRQELSVIKIEHADANILGEQLSEIYGAEIEGTAGGQTAAQRRNRARRRTDATAAAGGSDGSVAGPQVRILTDERTNSLLVLSSRQQLSDIRGLVRKLDIPVIGGGRIHVRYLQHADAEELAETLNALLSGAQSAGGSSGRPGSTGAAAAAPSLRSVVTPLADGVNVTADPATNALVIQASKEAYETLSQVIEKLDISRPQVLVEALIVEVDIGDDFQLGFGAAYRVINGDTDLIFSTIADVAMPGAGTLASGFRTKSFSDPNDVLDPSAVPDQSGSSNFVAQLSASERNSGINIVSAPHILTSDNEEAEIQVGDNIPIVTGRTEAATGGDSLSQAVNVERQDVGVMLRVTPQISEGNTVRLEIYQELTEVKRESLAGDPNEVGVSLTSRKVDNTVVVNDGETVAIGGLIREVFTDTESKVPFLGDIPVIGWAFKTVTEVSRKTNLLIFLTPHIVRNEDDLEQETIRKRLEFEDHLDDDAAFPELGDHEYRDSQRYGDHALAQELGRHSERYPIERMWAIEEAKAETRARRDREAEESAAISGQDYAVNVATYVDESEAIEALTALVDAGYDGSLISNETDGMLVFTLQVGPFEDLWSAQRAAETLDAAYGYSSSVAVLRSEDQ